MLLSELSEDGLQQVHFTNTHRVQPDTGPVARPRWHEPKKLRAPAVPVLSLANGGVSQPGGEADNQDQVDTVEQVRHPGVLFPRQASVTTV